MPELQSHEARFNRLYERHFDAVRAYAWRRTPSLADEIVAETFLVAWRRLAGFQQVRAQMPLHPDGAPEEVGGYDAGSLRFYDELIAGARRDDPTLVEQYLVANCAG